MDQNQTVDNDLQKAIDDITNTTNIDPVFSDPVAAPSSVPEGDTGELGEPVGPFPAPAPEPAPEPAPAPMPEPQVATVTPAPEPIAPLQSMDIPELNMPELAPPAPAPAPEAVMPPAPMPEPMPAPMPTMEPAPSVGLSMHQVKEAALRDLFPLLSHLNMAPAQKFNIYRNIFENLRDYTVLDAAYHAASEIPDERERAEALLYLVESIDKM